MAGNTFGQLFKVTTFGESHGIAIGGIVDGCPAGIHLDLESLQRELDRRKPGQSELTTQRKESDTIEILSGIFEGTTTGAPIAFILRNEDHKSSDYDSLKSIYRPGHADFVWDQKFGVRDHRGGGRSSARETAARVGAGAIAKQILNHFGVTIFAYVSGVKDIQIPVSYSLLDLSKIDSNDVRCPHPETATRMIALIEKTRDQKDSVGGIISGLVKGVPPGWGEPVFDKLHAVLGHAMLSINASKSFEIGDGLSATLRFGSENNDTVPGHAAKTQNNHDGGIQGGISNGKDIWFRVGFKPVSTIGKVQQTINDKGGQVALEAKGRHDPCVLPRAVPIVEAMTALVLVDALLLSRVNKV